MNKRMMEVAHDMKTPIQLICSCAQLLEMEAQPGTNAALYLKMLVESAQDLKNMVLSTLDGGEEKENICRESRDVVEEMRRTVRHFSMAAREKGISLSFSANVRSFIMLTDALKLRRIMENLIGNAIKATFPGGRIEAGVTVRGDGVDFTVADNGCGISPQNLSMIMQPGYTTGGHGMGLAIAEKYARMLGGCICVSSEENCGSRFTVHLPVRCEKISV